MKKKDVVSELEEMLAQAPSEIEFLALKESLSKSEAAVTKLHKSKQELTLLDDQLAVSQKAVRELKEAQESIAAQLKISEASLVKKDDEIQSLQLELSEQSTLANAFASQKTEILSLKESLSSTDRRHDAVQLDLEQSLQQLEVARKAVDDANGKANESKELLEKSQRETRQWEEERGSLKQLIATQREQVDRFQGEKNSALKQIAKFEDEIKQYQSKIEAFDKQNSELEGQRLKLEEAVRESAELKEELQTTKQRSVELDAALEKNATLERKTTELEQQIKALRDHETETLKEKTDQLQLLDEKNDGLMKQIGQLEASVKYSETATEDLVKTLEAQKSRIRELEQSAETSLKLTDRQTETAEQSRSQLLNIEATLQRQMDRMNSLEKLNQQSLAKISELQSAPSPRRASRKKLPEGHEDLTQINGVGPKFRQKLFDLGVKTIEEIALWSEDDTKLFAKKLGCGESTIILWSKSAADLVTDETESRKE